MHNSYLHWFGCGVVEHIDTKLKKRDTFHWLGLGGFGGMMKHGNNLHWFKFGLGGLEGGFGVGEGC